MVYYVQVKTIEYMKQYSGVVYNISHDKVENIPTNSLYNMQYKKLIIRADTRTSHIQFNRLYQDHN